MSQPPASLVRQKIGCSHEVSNGSCSKIDRERPLWERVASVEKPTTFEEAEFRQTVGVELLSGLQAAKAAGLLEADRGRIGVTEGARLLRESFDVFDRPMKIAESNERSVWEMQSAIGHERGFLFA